MPIHSDLLDYWKKNKETDDVLKALRFLFLSNLTFLGKGDTLKIGACSHKQPFYKYIDKTFEMLEGVQFMNKDFEKFFKSYENKLEDKAKTFIYCDPPYLGTGNNYSNGFTEEDSVRLFNCLEQTGCKFGMSEFDNPFILEQAKERGLYIHYLEERRNLGNRRVEVYICNYKTNQLEMF